MKTRALKQELDSIMQASVANQAFVAANIGGAAGTLPTELEEPKPLFVIDFEKIRKNYEKEAKETVTYMAEQILPKHYLNNKFVQHQIKIDSKALANLYYHQSLLQKLEEAGIESVGTGNLSPRMIEVINMTSENNSKFTKQIMEMITMFRKNYIDIMLDIQQKENAEMQAYAELENHKGKVMLEDKQVYVGSKEIIQELKRKKIAEAQKNSDK